MARRVESFEEGRAIRRYPWDEWTDGSIWEIERGEDYDVATENMRVNLHMRAKQDVKKLRSTIIRPSPLREGLRFQFLSPGSPLLRPRNQDRRHPVNDPRR